MKPPVALRPFLPRPLRHQGGWDEIVLFFGVPIVLFVFLRFLGLRRERREAAEEAERNGGGTDNG